MTLFEEIYKLKTILRKGWIIRNVCDKTANNRVESDAEHTFSMLMLALEIMNKEKLNLNQEKVLKMIAYHELGEIDSGDITPFDNISYEDKYMKEYNGAKRISETYNMPEILEYWLEFEENKTPEAQFVKKIDKLDSVLQSKIYSNICNKPDLFDEFNTSCEKQCKDFKKYIEETDQEKST